MGEVWLRETTLGQEAGRKGCREEKLGNGVDVLRSWAAMFGWTVGGDPQRYPGQTPRAVGWSGCWEKVKVGCEGRQE